MVAVASLRVGVLTASITRRAGGLYEAIPPLVKNLNCEKCEASVFSVADQTLDDTVHLEGIRLTVRNRWGPRAFGYAPGLSTELDAAGLDVVHTHGLWMYPSVAALRWAAHWNKPVVVSPHGMLDPWSLRHSAWKKRIAGWIFENRHLQRAACLHALNDAEYEAIRTYGLGNPVAVVPNGIDLPARDETPVTPEWAISLPQGARVLLFLGRLHPKKGLTNLLRAWAHLQRFALADAAPWYLVIAGWDQCGHEDELRRLAEGLHLGEKVRFAGPQFDAQKFASLVRADAFILPSLSEGLPMAILEAWSHQLPVLMTSECNLTEGFTAGAAMEIRPDPECLSGKLASFFGLPKEELLAMGARGRRLVEDCFDWSLVAARMARVYRWLVASEEKPDCVRIG